MPVVKIDPRQAPSWRLVWPVWGAAIATTQAVRIALVGGGRALGHRERGPIVFKNLPESLELSFKAFASWRAEKKGTSTRNENGGARSRFRKQQQVLNAHAQEKCIVYAAKKAYNHDVR